MKTKRLTLFGSPLVAAICAIACATPAFSGSVVYVETRATLSYSHFVGGTPIGNLTFYLPPATSVHNVALVTLCLPNVSLSQPIDPTKPIKADFEIVAPFAPGGLIAAQGSIGTDTAGVSQSAKKPVTIVLRVPLGPSSQIIDAEWDSLNGTVTTDTFASLSAVLLKE